MNTKRLRSGQCFAADEGPVDLRLHITANCANDEQIQDLTGHTCGKDDDQATPGGEPPLRQSCNATASQLKRKHKGHGVGHGKPQRQRTNESPSYCRSLYTGANPFYAQQEGCGQAKPHCSGDATAQATDDGGHPGGVQQRVKGSSVKRGCSPSATRGSPRGRHQYPSTKRHKSAGVGVLAQVRASTDTGTLEPSRSALSDPRLCGRGWHERWPPPALAKRRRTQLSLRDAFAMCPAVSTEPATTRS